jgi:hypothetical protein
MALLTILSITSGEKHCHATMIRSDYISQFKNLLEPKKKIPTIFSTDGVNKNIKYV